MADWLAARVRASPDATALVDPDADERLTYTELDEQATYQARALGALGISAGDHVAVALGVSVRGVALVHAVARVGAVLVPLSGRLTGSELGARVERADCDLLVCDETTRTATSAVGGVRVVSVDDLDRTERSTTDRVTEVRSDANEANGASEPGATDESSEGSASGGAGQWEESGGERLDDPLVILFTSGTTGRPKGVVLTAGNVLASAGASAARLGTLPDDRWLLALSLGGMGGLAPVYRSVLYGTALVCQAEFDPHETLRVLSIEACTGVSLVPTMLGRMLDALEDEGEKSNGEPPGVNGETTGDETEGNGRDGENRRDGEFPAGVRFVLLGGAPASRELIERCQTHGVPVHPTYGMTETASQVATARPTEAFSHPGTVGRPLMGVDVVAVDDRERAAAGERGELVVSGPIVTPGYYGDVGSGEADFSEHGFHTGDLGYVDDRGRVFVTGRLDDRIVTGGQTVDPEEVRTTLRTHPGVRDAAVVGLDSDEWGERVGALVVAATDDEDEQGRAETGDGTGTRDEGDEGDEEDEAVSAADLEAHCRRSLAGYKLPRVVAFADALPRTESGTVDRVAVAEEVRSAAEN